MNVHPPIPGYEFIEILRYDSYPLYLGRHHATGQLVRVSVAEHVGLYGQNAVAELRRQALILAGLDHPNIVRLVECDDVNGCRFFTAVQFISGVSFAEMARHQNLPDHREVVRLVRQVAAALDYAHGRNIVHGYVHPKHILMDSTRHVFLTGFGKIGPNVDESMALGNPHFLAPEQIEGSDSTVPQTDVYGLAEVIFRFLTGSYPFQKAVGVERLLKMKMAVQPPSIRNFRPELPRRVDFTLRKAMALRPENRHRSAGQFVEELDEAFGSSKERYSNWWQFWK